MRASFFGREYSTPHTMSLYYVPVTMVGDATHEKAVLQHNEMEVQLNATVLRYTGRFVFTF